MKVLALVGTGIKTISHITEEAKGYIVSCDKVLYLLNEPLLESYIKKIAKNSQSLDPVYFQSQSRENAYKNIANKIHAEMESVNSLCVILYGHPCVFATPGLLAISEFEINDDIDITVCASVSAQDCLYADLRFDPADGGVQTFDATEYLLYDKLIDIYSHVVIYQIGMVGNLGLPTNSVNMEAINFIKNKLIGLYNKNKKAIIYESALYPSTKPRISEFNLDKLEKQNLTTISTLYIPPVKVQRTANSEALKLLTKISW